MFALERNEGLKAILGAIYQSFAGKDVYPTIQEKAANFLYMIIKNHVFIDGNKRIAATLFIYFLDYYNILYKNGILKSEIDFTLDSAFKRLFKSPEFRFYQIAVLADLLKLDYKYIQDNMEYLDTEFVPNSNLEIKRSDRIIEIGKYVVILEMNRQNYRSLKASKLRYLAEVYNSVYFNKNGSESKKEVILVNINAFGVNKKCKDEFILQNKDYQEYYPGMKVLEINIASSMKKWYIKVTI